MGSENHEDFHYALFPFFACSKTILSMTGRCGECMCRPRFIPRYYDALLLVNQMAQVPDLPAGAPIAPTAALTQDELASVYRLPQLGDDENYAVVNGQVVRLNDRNYELLQMIRVARAIL